MTEYKSAKSKLCNAINRSKNHCWQDLVDQVDLWGFGSKLVTEKSGLRRNPVQLRSSRWTAISGHSFLHIRDDSSLESAEDCPFFFIKVLRGLAELLCASRPSCTFDKAGKIFEKLTGVNSLKRYVLPETYPKAIRAAGFRAGRYTVDAVIQVPTADELLVTLMGRYSRYTR